MSTRGKTEVVSEILVDSEPQSPYNAFGGGHTTESVAGQLTTTFPITGHL